MSENESKQEIHVGRNGTINTQVFRDETALRPGDKLGIVCCTWVYQSVNVWGCVCVCARAV